MKLTFIWRVVFLVAGLILADRMVGWVMHSAIQRQRNGVYYEFKYKVTQAKAAIVVLGSSRANHHYNVNLIEEATHEKAMNYGQDGTSVFTHYILLKTLLHWHKPKLVVLDIKPGDFGGTQNFNEVAPLYPIIDEVAMDGDDLNMVSPFEKIKLYSQCYRYNNQVLEILGSTRGKPADTSAITGYSALPVKSVVLDNLTINDSSFNSSIYKYFKQIILLCKQANIRLIVCTSPCYRPVVFDRTIAVVETECKISGVEYINYLNNTLLPFDAGMFKDEMHLNTKGADAFTQDFIKRLPPF